MKEVYRNIRLFSFVLILMLCSIMIYSYFTVVISSVGKRRYSRLEAQRFLPGQKTYQCTREKQRFWNTIMTEHQDLSHIKCLQKNRNKTGIFAFFVQQNFENVNCLNGTVKFSETNRTLVALASFPGSGNTWYRHLIETISGIATGSQYCSRRLRPTFIGECKKNFSKTIAIKTHAKYRGIAMQGHFGKAVLIFRNLYDTVIAEFNRQNAGKMATVERASFRTDDWSKFVAEYSPKWRNHALSWVDDWQGPFYISLYEKMKSEFFEELYRLVKFLELQVTYKDLWCASVGQAGMYHRKKPDWLIPSNVFSAELDAIVTQDYEKVLQVLKSRYQIKITE